MKEDSEYLMKKISPEKNITLPLSHFERGQMTSDIVKEKLSLLTVQEREALDKLYQIDFNLFDYDLDEEDKPRCGERDRCC